MTGSNGGHGAVVAFRDITERHMVELMKQEFVSAVSHELRTPLTSIRGSLELLADGAAGELPGTAHEIVAMAQRGSERLSRLVNDIIDIERLESGSFRIEPTPQNIEPLVKATVSSLQALAEQGHVSLVVDQARGHALCDADRVVQALVNLVGNALKFTPPGGTVRINATPDDHEVVFAISDEGRGIPAGRAGGHLRAVPPGQQRRCTREGRHRPGAHDHQVDRGTTRRAHLGGERGRRRVDVLVHPAAGAGCE